MVYLVGYVVALFFLFWGLAAYFLAVGLYVACLFFYDKIAAVRGAVRVPERLLLLGVFAGGAPFAMMAMLVMCHKTRKPRFVYGAVLMSLVQMLLAFACF